MKQWLNQHWKLMLILLLATLLMNVPNRFDLPVGQTDQAHFYAIAQSVSLGYTDTLPLWANYDIKEVTSTTTYPYLFTRMFVLLSYVFDEINLLNGLFISIFFILALIYLFKLVRDLTHNVYQALIIVLFFSFNLRIFYFAIAGVWPFLIAALLTIPALYYLNRYLNESKGLLWLFFFNFLVIHAHQFMGLFLLVGEALFIIGHYMEKYVTLMFPKIAYRITKISWSQLIQKSVLILGIPSALFFINAILFTLTQGRVGWINTWIDYLLSPFQGFQQVWTHFFIFDGPLVALIGFVSVVYFMYTNKFKLLSLWIWGISIIVLPLLFFGNSKLATYSYKFYVLFFLILVIGFIQVIFALGKEEKIRYLAYVVLGISIAIQVVKLMGFLVLVTPAITTDEFEITQKLQLIQNESILYIVADDTSSSFHEFKWIPILAKSNNFGVQRDTSTLKYNESDFNYHVIISKDSILLRNNRRD